MPQFEIVCHCWRYDRSLTYQLSSLLLFPPQVSTVGMTVFYCAEDEATSCVVEFFHALRTENIAWNFCSLPREQLFRRAYGRNLAALNTRADWIWFADADFCWRESCLDDLASVLSACDADLVFPRVVQASRSHEVGERSLRLVEDGPKVVDVDPTDFCPQFFNRATGGLQITRGDVVRKKGYCNGKPWLNTPPPMFGGFNDDVVYRRTLGTRGTPIDVPHVYRIRHYPGPHRRSTPS